jgi:4-hydroxybenzoate polyprenyltransferase
MARRSALLGQYAAAASAKGGGVRGKEVRILWGFCGGDVTAALLPPLLFTAAAMPSWSRAAPVLGEALLYFVAFGLCFTIANQVTSIEEDRLNKPQRPLVRGLLSVQGAWVRWGVWTLVLLALGVHAQLLLPTLAWIGVAIITALGWDRSWVVKNGCMLVGVVVQLASAWRFAAPLTPPLMRFIGGVALAFAILVSVQDLRDIAGDRARGRSTVPMAWGELPLRRFLVVGFLLVPAGMHLLLGLLLPVTFVRLGCEVLLAALSWLIAWRVWHRHHSHADHITYLLFTLLYCGLLATCALASAVSSEVIRDVVHSSG